MLFKLFCLGTCFPHGHPSQGAGLLTREKRPSLSRGPRRTVPSGKLGLLTPITISLNLSLDFLCVGHEHPYGIQKSNLPATVLLILKLEDSTSDSTQGPRELPGQFILKPRHTGRHQQQKVSASLPASVHSWLMALFRETSCCQGNDSPNGKGTGQKCTEDPQVQLGATSKV